MKVLSFKLHLGSTLSLPSRVRDSDLSQFVLVHHPFRSLLFEPESIALSSCAPCFFTDNTRTSSVNRASVHDVNINQIAFYECDGTAAKKTFGANVLGSGQFFKNAALGGLSP